MASKKWSTFLIKLKIIKDDCSIKTALFASVETAVCFFQALEACVKNCGRRFHQEVGKFRFLNEMIKVVSPKVCCVYIILK